MKKIFSRKTLGLVFCLLAVSNLVYQYFKAVDFSTQKAVKTVDSQLVDYLRKHPGHPVPLQTRYNLTLKLNLKEDSLNRWLFGTEVDLREQVARRAIHIQIRQGRGAIHTDLYNPTSGLWSLILHNSLDVPTFPLLMVLFLSLLAVFYPSKKQTSGDAK